MKIESCMWKMAVVLLTLLAVQGVLAGVCRANAKVYYFSGLAAVVTNIEVVPRGMYNLLF